MASTGVSNTVLSIVTSFTSGLDVFKKLREKRRRGRRSKTRESIDEEELRLSRSLRQGPEDIGRAYQRSIQGAGEQFAVGDAIAQTHLAEILLKLNTGLVSIITSFLHRGKVSVQLDYRSLTDLSELSREETVGTLHLLFHRMMQARQQQQRPPRAIKDVSDAECKRRPANHTFKKTKEPQLARIVIQDSSRPSQLAMVKAGAQRKKRRSPSGSGTSTETANTPSAVSSAPTSPTLVNPPLDMPQKVPARPMHVRAHTAPEVPKPRRKHSAAEMYHPPPPIPPKPEELRTTRSTSKLRTARAEQKTPPPPPLPTASARPTKPTDLPSKQLQSQQRAPDDVRRRKLTPTYYSIATDSTKLGEIPLHRWAEPFDFDAASIKNREAAQNGWPVNEWLEQGEGKKKRGGLFRLFRRMTSEEVY